MNEEALEAVRRLHFWQYGNNPDNFTSMLYTMFGKADALNRSRLAMVFPAEYWAWREWQDSPSQDEFFERYGLPSFRMMYSQEIKK